MPSKFLGRYLHMRIDMPALAAFEVTSRFGGYCRPVTDSPGNIWVEKHRGLLWFALRTTLRHPQLKLVIWNEANTVYENKLDDEIWDWHYILPIVELIVTLLSKRPNDPHTM